MKFEKSKRSMKESKEKSPHSDQPKYEDLKK